MIAEVLKLVRQTPTLETAMTSRNQGHSGAVFQSKLAPVSSVSGPNSHVIALIMQLLVLLIVFLFRNVLAVPETNEHTLETTFYLLYPSSLMIPDV